MSDCGCGSNDYYGDSGAYNSYCNADTPYPSISHESVPSLIDNLVNALYGAITKDVSSGKVVWNIPCDPANIPATINNIPRNAGEGLLCYIIRALNLTGGSGIVTVDGTQTLTNKTLTAPIINNAPIIATGSITPRTLENRFADVVNVRDFGAKGDGTTDDTAAIQASFTAANGGPVLFPKGQYYVVSTPYNLNAGNGAISFNDGASNDVWLQTRKLTGSKAVGAGTLGGFSPSGFMFDLQEDCSISSDFMVANRTRHRFGGSSVTGGRIGVLAQLFQTSATSSSNTNRNYVGVEGSVTSQSSDGGTNTTTDAKGAYFGGNLASYIGSTSTNLYAVCGAEINTFVSAGASSKYQFGMNVACANAQKATGYDAAINISGYNDGTIAHAGYGVGLLFSSSSGAEPFSATSTIIAAVTASSATVQTGIDFSTYTITNNIIKGKYSRLSETKLIVGDSSGFSVIQGGSQSTDASLLLRPKGTGSVYLQDSTGTVTMLRADQTGTTIVQTIRPDADGTRNLGDVSFRWSTLYANSLQIGSGPTISTGTGSPEGNVTAQVGSTYTNTSGVSGQTLYVKETGSGNTGWAAAVTAGMLTTTTATLASGSAVALTTATAKTVTSISLAAGTWDVSGVVDFSLSGATSVFGANNYIAGINTTNNTLGGQDTYLNRPLIVTAGTGTMTTDTPARRLTLATTTTVYLIAQATFIAGTVSAYGTITANRVF